MERFRCLPGIRVVYLSSDEVREWIPTRKEFRQVYKNVRMTGNKPHISRIIPTSRKIGRRTFVEGCFDAVLMVACWSGNVPIVSYLLTIYLQFFSIDTLIDKLSPSLGGAPVFDNSKGVACLRQVACDKVSLLHAAAEGMQLDVIKLLLSAGANVNNPSKWLISPLMSVLLCSGLDIRTVCRHRDTVACLIDSGAN